MGATSLDLVKWNKDVKRAGFRLYDPRPLENRIVYGEPMQFHLVCQQVDAVNLYSETRELIDGVRFIPAFADHGFVGVLDIGKYARGYIGEMAATQGFLITVVAVGIRYSNTFEPDCRVQSIEPCLLWSPMELTQEAVRPFIKDAMEQTVAQSAQRAQERSEKRKGFFDKLFGR